MLLFLILVGASLSTINFGMETTTPRLTFPVLKIPEGLFISTQTHETESVQSYADFEKFARLKFSPLSSTAKESKKQTNESATLQNTFVFSKKINKQFLLAQRPCVELVGEIPSETIYSRLDGFILLTALVHNKKANKNDREIIMKELKTDTIQLDAGSNIDTVTASIEKSKIRMTLKETEEEEGSSKYITNDYIIALENNTEGTTLFINKHKLNVLVGCANGQIQIIDIRTKEIELWSGHQSPSAEKQLPINAIRVANNGNTILSQVLLSDDGTYKTAETFIWYYDDRDGELQPVPLPRFVLPKTIYTTCYIFNNCVVRSNVGGKYLGYGDHIYKISQTWLNGLSLQNVNVGLYLLAVKAILRNYDQNTASSLYNAPILECLPKSVAEACKHDLQLKAQKEKQILYDNLIDSI